MKITGNRVGLFCFVVGMLAVFSTVYAAEQSNVSAAIPNSAPTISNGSSTVDSTTSVWSHMHASYFGNFHGPSLTNFSSPNTVDQNGKISKTAMYFDSELGATYMFDDSLGMGAVLPFFLYATRGEGAILGDAGIKLVNKKTVSTSNFNLYTNLIFQLPTSDYSKARNMDFSIKTTPNVRYIISGTRYTIGAWTEAKAYLGATSGKLFKLYAAPYVNYQLTPKLSLNMQYELEADHFAKNTGPMDFQMYQNDLMPGVIYMVTPNVMVNPYLQIFTADKIASDHMAVGAVVTASL